jgi:filamentous hemagglutinin family protein
MRSSRFELQIRIFEMNAGCYKIVFSKRLGVLVAVGEHTLGQGKAAGTGIRTASAANQGLGFGGLGFVGLLKAAVASVAIALLGTGTGTATAADLARNALPTGAVVNAGNVAISTQGAAMTIQQTTDKASINWNAFNIGSGASVNVQQNSVNSVLLNRVVGNDPSQILGKLTANGQVVLINPNGIVFGKDGSVAASAFTASTFGISEKDFANGHYNYTRNGSTAAVTVENGASLSATARGGYVALIGASVDNQGTISTQGGSVLMVAGEKAALPEAMTGNVSVPLSGKVRLDLLPSTINAMVSNSGTITTEGGQVLMQAAALSDAVASITHTGTIDTTGTQGGAVTLQADQGNIQVSGSVKANSTGAGNAGGDVVMGRDMATGVLAKTTDVSGAKLESQGGFVETSGEYLKTDGISVKAKDWLLDPNDIVIGSTTTTGGSLSAAQAANGVSRILASDVSNALTAGSNVTIATSASATGGNGDITVAAAISNTAAGNTLTLNAGRNVILNSNITASNIALNAATGSVSGTGNLTATGTTTINSTAAGTLSGAIGGTGGLTKTGAGQTTLTGSNTYTGGTKVVAGILQIGDGTTNGRIAPGTADIASGATLDFKVSGSVDYSTTNNTFTGTGTLKKSGLGTLTWGGSGPKNTLGIATFAMTGGLIDVQGGTLVGGSWGNDVWTNNKASLNVATGATFAGVESNIVVDALTGGGTVSSGYAGYPFGLTVGVNNGSGTFSGVIKDYRQTVPAKLTKTGSGTQTLTGTNTYTGTTTIEAGTLQLGNAGTTGSIVSTSAITNKGILAINRTDALATPFVLSNNISGTGKLVNQGTGTTKLMGTSTFSGGVTVSKGNIIIGNGGTTPNYNNAVGTGSITMGDANTGADNIGVFLDMGQSASQVPLTRAVNVTNNGTGTVTLGGLKTSTSGAGWTSFGGPLNLSKSINFYDGTGDRTSLDGLVTGNGDITLTNGRSIMGSSVQNTFTGNYTVNSGAILQLNSALALSANNNLINNGTTKLNGGQLLNINGLSGTGILFAENLGLTTPSTVSLGNGVGGNFIYGGQILIGKPIYINNVFAGYSIFTANLIKNGTGTQTLTGTNTYSGTTTINGGTLQIGDGSALAATLGAGAVTLTNGANLNYARAIATSIANSISGTGNVNATITGSSNALTVDNTISLTNGKINLVTDGNLTVNKAISTTDNTTSAIFLEAGKAIAAGTSTTGVGDVTIGPTGSATANNGRITFMTGSLASGSTLGVATGNNRYYSDEETTSYTASLGSTGRYAIYREAPTLTATFNNASKTYDGLTYAGNSGVSAYTGFVNGDTTNVVHSTQYNGNAEGAKNEGTYAISGNALSGLGYKVIYTAGTLTINKANLVLSGTRVYDASKTFAGQYLTATGVAGETFTLTGAGDASNLTNKNVQATQTLSSVTGIALGSSSNGGLISNYNAISTTGSSVNVTAKAATITGTATNVTYNGGTQTQTTEATSGFIIGDAITITGLASGKDAGSYASSLSVGGNDANNYSVTVNNANLVIGKAALTATGNSSSVTYNGSDQSVSGFSLSGLQGSDTVSNLSSITASGATAKNAGSYTNTVTAGTETNYTVTTANGSLDIAKANLVLSGTRVYDASQTFAGQYLTATGVNGEIFTVTGSGDVTNLNTKNVQTNQKLSSVTGLSLSDSNNGALNSNYNAISTAGSSVNVTAKKATITGTTTNLTYNGASQTQTAAVLAGFVDADVTGGTVGATGVATGRNAGTYISNLSATGVDKDNYNITVTNKDLVIDKKDASITGTTTNVTYNSLTQNQDAAVLSGFIAADVTGGTVGATGVATGRNAGTYTSNLSATGVDKDNYNITVTNKDLVIDKKDASITGTSTNVTYNSLTQNQDAAVLSGFIAADVSGGTVVATGVATGRNAGTYTSNLSATGVDKDNYNITVTNKDLVIDKKSITLSGITAANKTYDGNTTATVSVANASFNSKVAGDDLSVSSTGTFSDKNAATAKTVSLTNSLGGADLANYTITDQASTTADITQKSITLSGITAANKTYDGTTAATITAGAIATGIANETLAVSGAGTFSDKNAADGKIVTVSDITTLVKANGTGDWRNYNLTSTGSITTTANIDKKNVTLDSITAANKIYDGTDTATITAGSITTGVGNETLAISGKGKFADTAPGTNKVVTVADVTTLTKTNGTGNWNNYKLSNTGSKATKATITAVPPSPPAPTPSSASTSSGSAAPRVKIPLGSSNPFQLASVEMLVDEVCSGSNLESCFCEASAISTDVSICYEKSSKK